MYIRKAQKTSSYRDIFFKTSGGEHTIEFRSRSLLCEQCKDDGVGQHRFWVILNYLTIDTQQDTARLGADYWNAV